MSYSEADLAKLLHSNPDLVLVTDGDYTTLQPAAKPVQDKPKRESPEHDLQVAVIAECDKRAILRPEWGLIFAIPNGGHRHPAVAGKLKAEGVRAGVPDLFVPVARHGKYGLFIELKISPNMPTESQRQWLQNLQMEGYHCRVVWDSVDEVIGLIEWYLEGEK